MADATAGIYAAIGAELLAALQTPAITVSGATNPGVSVVNRCGLIDLCTREGLREHAIGIWIDAAKFREAYGIGNRMRGVDVTVLIFAAVRNASSVTEQKRILEGLLEVIRDRVNFLATTTSSRRKYVWMSDAFVEIEGSDRAGAVAEFRLQANFGI